MRRFILSTLALAALASPAAAQERICREPSSEAIFFVDGELSKLRFQDERVELAELQRRADRLKRIEVESLIVFDQSFRKNCKAGDLIQLTSNFRAFVSTHCDMARPVNQFGDAVICFAQVPPRE
jgi:hypothetical protein